MPGRVKPAVAIKYRVREELKHYYHWCVGVLYSVKRKLKLRCRINAIPFLRVDVVIKSMIQK